MSPHHDIYVLLLNQFAFCNGTAFTNAQAEALVREVLVSPGLS